MWKKAYALLSRLGIHRNIGPPLRFRIGKIKKVKELSKGMQMEAHACLRLFPMTPGF